MTICGELRLKVPIDLPTAGSGSSATVRLSRGRLVVSLPAARVGSGMATAHYSADDVRVQKSTARGNDAISDCQPPKPGVEEMVASFTKGCRELDANIERMQPPRFAIFEFLEFFENFEKVF